MPVSDMPSIFFERYKLP